MSSPYTAALVDLRAWRDHVDFLIASLEKLESGVVVGTAMPAPIQTAMAAVPAAVPARPAKQAKPRAEVHVDEKSQQLLDALEKAGKPLSPGEVKEATGFSAFILQTRLELLVKAKRIVITGKTADRRIALPGTAAKEGL